MENETKLCQFCGEKILNIAIKCKHCGSMLNDESHQEKPNVEEMILADKGANLFRGIEGVGGRLKLTTKKLIFKAHAINIQKQGVEIPIDNIECIVKKNSLFIIPNKMVVVLKSGVEYKFVVNGRDSLISLIEKQLK